jgi:hypothetical protein
MLGRGSQMTNRGEKKTLDLDRTRVSHGAKSRHGFRKSWPRKKALAQRVVRQHVRAEAEALLRGADPDSVPSRPLVLRPVVRKWRAPTLREWIALRKAYREGKHGAKQQRASEQDERALLECEY